MSRELEEKDEMGPFHQKIKSVIGKRFLVVIKSQEGSSAIPGFPGREMKFQENSRTFRFSRSLKGGSKNYGNMCWAEGIFPP